MDKDPIQASVAFFKDYHSAGLVWRQFRDP